MVLVGVGVVGTAPPAVAGGGGCHRPRTDATGSTVETRDACFTPTVLRVEPGTTVTFVNRDGMEHAVAGQDLGFYELGEGAEATHRFDAPGVYAYQCYLHPTMTGAVVVGDAAPVLAAAGGLPSPGGDRDAGAWPAVAGVAIVLAVGAVARDVRRARKARMPEA
jgi:plastocyanin